MLMLVFRCDGGWLRGGFAGRPIAAAGGSWQNHFICTIIAEIEALLAQ
jgi:hypothetical protein